MLVAETHLLSQETGDLGEVDLGALGSRHRHHGQAILGEGLHLAPRQAHLPMKHQSASDVILDKMFSIHGQS